MNYGALIDTDLSHSMLSFRLFSSIILSCYSIGTCKGESELKILCENFIKEDGTTYLK